MRLEKLQLFGFKSFADKTQFKFKDGVTAIVGPNGSGKSNIVDAFRWILGEQSAKSLRGTDMKDVIFNGTTKRKPLGFAEASLHFSHAEDLLGEGNEKLVIARRLYRSGESEYLINGKLARLKDIKETLAGTGVGFNAYSILEQDKIDKILSANPDERRLVFEEAAGVSAYRVRRKKTQRELERTEQYLARLGDMVGELRSRERSVRIQAGRARRHRELTERLNRLKLDLYMLKFRSSYERLREIEGEIEEVQREVSQFEGSLRLTESELARKGSSLHSLNEHLKQLQTEKTRAQTRAVEEEQRITYNKRRISDLAKRAGELAVSIQAVEEKIEKALGERAGLEARLRELSSCEAAAKGELKAHKLKIYEASVRLQELEDAQEAFRESGTRALGQNSAVRNELANLTEDLKRWRVNCERSSAKREKLSRERAGLADSVAKLDKEIETLATRRSQLTGELEQAEEKLRATERGKVECQFQRDTLAIDRARRQSRLDTLKALLARHAGIDAGAQHLLSKRGEQGFECIQGVLGELIEVDIENAAMVETALGRLAQALVVDTPEVGANLAQYLEEDDCGSAVFVPVQWDAVPYPDCSGRRLVGLVRSDGRYRNLLERLIGDVRVADSVEEALEAFTHMPGLRFVTPSGEMVGAGLLSGGSRREGGIIQRKSEVTTLENEIAQIDEKLTAVACAIEERESVRSRLDAQCTQLSSDMDGLAQQVGALRAHRGELARDCSITETELRMLEVEIDDLEAQIAHAQARSEELSREFKALEDECLTRQKELEENQAQIAHARQLRESLMEQLADVTAKVASAEQERQSLARELQSKESEVAERHQRRVSLEEEARKTEEAAAAARKDVDEAGRTLNNLLESIQRTREKLNESQEQRRGLESQIAEARGQRDRVGAKLREADGRCSEMRIERQGCSTQIENVAEYARQELGIEIHDDIHEAILPDADPAALQEEVDQTRHKLERLGNVNMEALEELEEVTARLTFYTNQEQDLLVSKNKLMEVMAKIDRKCRVSLQRSFNDIRKNFQSVFRKLFNGGRADIYFEEGADILEAGIEIVAKPPGKELANLSLLSGGEKAMTTIALLFAIFRSKLSPFCILDEIDAPLDESNVNRFQQLLREFTRDCRFLIITHNKVSMAASDTLYGITMQEPGVSKRISITFEEALKHARSAPEEETRKSPVRKALVSTVATTVGALALVFLLMGGAVLAYCSS